MNSKIVVANKISEYVPNNVYVVWDIKKAKFFRMGCDCSINMHGVWTSEDSALRSINYNENDYAIICINVLDTMSHEFKWIVDLVNDPMWCKNEVQQMLISKLRQSFEVFLFSNGEMINYFAEQYTKKLEPKQKLFSVQKEV